MRRGSRSHAVAACVGAASLVVLGSAACSQIIGTKDYFYQDDAEAIADAAHPVDATTEDAAKGPSGDDDGSFGFDGNVGNDAAGDDDGDDASADANANGDASDLDASDGNVTDASIPCTSTCYSGSCSGGKCQPFSIATFPAVTALAMGPDYLYISEGVNIHAMERLGTTQPNSDGGLQPFATFNSGAIVTALTPVSPNLYIAERTSAGGTDLFSVSLLGFSTAHAFAAFNEPSTVDVTATSDNGTAFFLDDMGAYTVGTADAAVATRLANVTTGVRMLLTIDQQKIFVSSLGTTFAAPVVPGTGVSTPYGNGYLAQDSNAVYFASPTQLVFVPPTFTGGTPTTIYANANLDVGGIFVDGSNIYFVDEGNTTTGRSGSILECSKTNIATTPCATATVVATGLTHPTTLVGDSNALYFLTDDGTQFTLNAVAKPH